MKIAIFHNYMDNIGGAEIVSLTFARELNADVYTTVFDAERIANIGFADIIPRIHSIGSVPKQAPFKQQLAFWKFRRLNLGRQYDFYIISGDWAMSGAVNNTPNLWYAHSPLNELWEFRGIVRRTMVSRWEHPIFDFWVWFNRKLTLSYSKHVVHWVCNSSNTKRRIKKYYGKDATVIYPPTDTSKYRSEKNGGYWLSVNRLLNHKRIEIQIDAFAKMSDKRLVIVGSYEKGVSQFETYRMKIQKMTPPNVTFKYWVDDKELIELYAQCAGFITTARDEDFGMTAIEAMASGKPVVAPNEGGYKESVLDGKTGLLIENIDDAKLAASVRKIDDLFRVNPEYFKQASINRARFFDTSNCIAQIKKKIV